MYIGFRRRRDWCGRAAALKGEPDERVDEPGGTDDQEHAAHRPTYGKSQHGRSEAPPGNGIRDPPNDRHRGNDEEHDRADDRRGRRGSPFNAPGLNDQPCAGGDEQRRRELTREESAQIQRAGHMVHAVDDHDGAKEDGGGRHGRGVTKGEGRQGEQDEHHGDEAPQPDADLKLGQRQTCRRPDACEDRVPDIDEATQRFLDAVRGELAAQVEPCKAKSAVRGSVSHRRSSLLWLTRPMQQRFPSSVPAKRSYGIDGGRSARRNPRGDDRHGHE